MTIFTVIALADLRNRIAAAADMLNRVAGNLAGCLPKPPPNAFGKESVMDPWWLFILVGAVLVFILVSMWR